MIEPLIYNRIAELIGKSQDNGDGIVDSMNSAVSDLSLSETSSLNNLKQWLMSSLTIASDKLNSSHKEYSMELIKIVSALQSHVITNYGSIDNYLKDNDITVSQSFADISANCGYPVSADYII